MTGPTRVSLAIVMVVAFLTLGFLFFPSPNLEKPKVENRSIVQPSPIPRPTPDEDAIRREKEAALALRKLEMEQTYREQVSAFGRDRDEQRLEGGLQEVARKYPEYAKTYFQLGYVSTHLEKWSEATGYYRRFLELAPNSSARDEVRQRVAALQAMRSESGKKLLIYRDLLREAYEAKTSGDLTRMAELAGEAAALLPGRWEALVARSEAFSAQLHWADAGVAMEAGLAAMDDPHRASYRPILENLRHERDVAEAQTEIQQLIAKKQWRKAAERAEASWMASPKQNEFAFSALQCFVLVKDFPGCSRVLRELREKDKEQPLSLSERQRKILFGKLDGNFVRLSQLSTKLTAASTVSNKSTRKKTSTGKKTTMTEDFLKRIR